MSIKVILDNQGPIYPGTLLQGKVICNFSSSTDVRAIKIRFYGKEHTEWRTQGKHKTTYWGTHHFFQMETKLLEPPNGVVQKGQYEYPFTFLLPQNVPSTFEFPYGYTRFSLKGIIDIPIAIDPRDRVDLLVVSVLDSAGVPAELRAPFRPTDEAMMGCCWCYDTDPVKMIAQIEKRAYIPGETIKVRFELQNTSNDNVEEVTVKLMRSLVAHSQTPRQDVRFINEDLVKMKLRGVRGGREQSYDVDLHIPYDMPVPNLSHCQLLEAIHRVEVDGTTSGCNRKLNLVIAEVKIGHVDSSTTAAVSTAPPLNNGYSGYPYPGQSTSTGYPYPTGDTGKGPSLGFGELAPSPSAPPPRYEDVTAKEKM